MPFFSAAIPCFRHQAKSRDGKSGSYSLARIGGALGHKPLRASGEGLAIAELMKSGDNAIATSATKSGRSSAIGRARNALEESE
jgi:hypothetical protein